MMNTLEQASFHLKREKIKTLTRLDMPKEAEVACIDALDIVIKIAEREKQEDFKDAISLFEILLPLLEKGPYLEST